MIPEQRKVLRYYKLMDSSHFNKEEEIYQLFKNNKHNFEKIKGKLIQKEMEI